MEIVRDFENNKHILIKGTFEEPLFRATDIGEILELTNIHKTIREFSEQEKVSITLMTPGGPQKISFLTEKGLYKVLFRSRMPVAEKFQDWICEVIKEIRINGQYKLQKELEEKEKELEETKEKLNDKTIEADELRDVERPPKIYIYNIDSASENPELKIGYTKDVYKRYNSFKQTNKRGKIEMTKPLPGYTKNITTVENYIHNVFKKYRVAEEVFKVDLETAKLILIYIISITEILELTDEREIKNKLQKIVQYITQVKDNHNINISTNNISTQTDEVEEIPNVIPAAIIEENKRTEQFNKFIDSECIVRSDVDVSSTDIMGQYRIWAKQTDKETFHALHKYLKIRFVYGRVDKQNKNQVVNGYIGIKLKPIEYKKSLLKTDEETFIFHSCIFSPSGKVLFAKLEEQYVSWLKDIKKINIGIKDKVKELKKYLKTSPYTVQANVWTNDGNGNGFYGIYLKGDEKHYKKSTTGKLVEKRELNTDIVIANYETIAKAAESEQIAPCTMSRAIKNKIIFNSDYYYCLKKSPISII